MRPSRTHHWKQSLGVILLTLPGLLFSLLRLAGNLAEKHNWVRPFLAWGCVLWLASIPLFIVGLILTRSFRREEIRSDRNILNVDDRPPVLYLRSFKDDQEDEKMRYVMLGGVSLTPEEQLVSVLNEIGPCIAVGCPGKKTPVLGAERVNVGSKNWKEFIIQKMGEASLVVILAGRGPNLAWEVTETLNRVEPEKIVFLVRGGMRNYDDFIDQTQPLLAGRCELPRIAGFWNRFKARILFPRWVQWVIFFSPNWSPRVEVVDGGLRDIDLSRIRQQPMEAAFRRVLNLVAERIGRPSLKAPLLPPGAWRRLKYWILSSDTPSKKCAANGAISNVRPSKVENCRGGDSPELQRADEHSLESQANG